MYQKMSLDAYRNRLLRVISVIIEIINYPFKLEKMRFKRPFFNGPPLAVASLEKKDPSYANVLPYKRVIFPGFKFCRRVQKTTKLLLKPSKLSFYICYILYLMVY